MTNRSGFAVTLLCLFGVIACNGTVDGTRGAPTSDGGRGHEHEDGGTAKSSLLETCAGDYQCIIEDYGKKSATTLHRVGNACFAGELRLDPDGGARGEGITGATWTGDASYFRICVPDGCFACALTSEPTTPGAPPKACKGTSATCAATPVATCLSQSGCRVGRHWKDDANGGHIDEACEGTARACDALTSETTCKKQSGCRWE
jgi:hypothetical protein